MAIKVTLIARSDSAQHSQLSETFLSSKHLNYLAVIAEFWSAVRA